MGYRSEVALKTTTEGWVILQQLNHEVEEEYSKPLYGAVVETNSAGFYRIGFSSVKWYDEFPQVINFRKALAQMREENIPYSYIRIGEEIDDIEHDINWTTDETPDEIETFTPEVTIYDDSSYDRELDPDEYA